MESSELFKKHFGDVGMVDLKHPKMEAFLSELNEVCQAEDKYIKTLDGMMKDSEIDCHKCDKTQDAEFYNPECRYLTKIRCPKCYGGNLYTRGRFALKKQTNEKN